MREDFDPSVGLIWLTRLIDSHTAEIRRDTERLRRKYDPNQPRVPRGQSNGGQWTDGGGGSGGSASQPTLSGPRLQDEINRSVNGGDRTARMRDLMTPAPLADPGSFDRWWTDLSDTAVPNTSNPPLQNLAREVEDSLDPVAAARRRMLEDVQQQLGDVREALEPRNAIKTIGTLAVSEAIASAKTLKVLAALPPMAGAAQWVHQNEKIRKAAETIEKFLKGKPDFFELKRYKHTDLVSMTAIKGDIQVRFDIAKFGNKAADRPHFQIQEREIIQLPNGQQGERWVDLGDHWYYFSDSIKYMKGRKAWK